MQRLLRYTLCFVLLTMSSILLAQEFEFPFQDPDLDTDARVEDLLKRLTLEEKVAQMQDVSPAIGRLGIPEYNWWNECLHGVARAGRATSFPQAIGMAATWNTDLVHKIADVISTEARAKHNVAVENEQRNRYQGLTMWTPNINIFRDPRWGRGQETYGEDPFLTSQLAVAFVKGLQGDHPEYLKVVATPKHYAVHSGPEHNRHSFNAITNKKDLWETYLPAFEAAVKEGGAFSVMSAYNRYLGESATASKLLLNDILREKWGFEGYVVSDCGAVYDIYKFHNIVETAAEASALAVKAGCDLNCGSSYRALVKAVEDGLIGENDIDKAMRRLIAARMKLGLFNPPGDIPFSEYDEKYIEAKEHGDLALKTARESIVLLKNEKNTLPLSKELNTITVVGPNANDKHFLLGNYFGVPTEVSTVLDGIRKKAGKQTKINYFKGVNLYDNEPVTDVVGNEIFKGGVKTEYYNNSDFEGQPVHTAYEKRVDFEWGGAAPIELVRPGKFSIRYSGTMLADEDGEVAFGVLDQGGSYKLYIDNELILTGSSQKDHKVKKAAVVLKKGTEYTFKLEYSCTNEWLAAVQLLWDREARKGEKYMMQKMDESDVIIFVGGITARLEGEEMPVEVDGFYKGDRTNLEIPEPQKKLLKKLKATGKPVVFVLTTGSAIACNWEQENLDAIINAWYPGQAGGDAIADVLFGDYNPSGKLPLTFYKSVSDLPDFEDYAMKGRTYRYFEGDVLYPFGYGLSYTQFSISKPILSEPELRNGGSLKVNVEVKNTGEYNGETVIQLYARRKDAGKEQPLRSLRGFQKVWIQKGKQKTVEFTVDESSLWEVDEKGSSNLKKGVYELFVGEDARTLNGVVVKVSGSSSDEINRSF